MGLRAAGNTEFENREFVNENDLIGKKFLVERVGKEFTSKGKFKTQQFPVEVTVEGLGERVYFAQGRVICDQIRESDGLEGLTLTIEWREPAKEGGNRYKVLTEVE